MTDLELMNIHAEVLFIHDNSHRIVSLNRPDRSPAPRFFLGRTGEGNIWRFRNDLPKNTLVKLDRLAAAEPVSRKLDENSVYFHDYLMILAADTRSPGTWSGPAFRFPRHYGVKRSQKRIVEIQKHNAHYLEKGYPDMIGELDLRKPVFALVEAGVAVSICCSARATEKAAEAGIETLEQSRGRGYAPEVASMWAEKIRESGRIPLFSTSWSNRASMRVAGKLHLKQYGVDAHMT